MADTDDATWLKAEGAAHGPGSIQAWTASDGANHQSNTGGKPNHAIKGTIGMTMETCEFLHGERLSAGIRAILREPGARAAVAFWGGDSRDWLEAPDARIVCDLGSGSTNPSAIEAFGDRARQMDALHAKVYIGAEHAIVTSANASANGLGLEGIEQSFWTEAGILTTDTAPIVEWFEDIWGTARPITRADLDAAREAWKRRRRTRPPIRSFNAFDPAADDVPLVAWQHSRMKWDLIDEAFDGIEGDALDDHRRRADGGLDISHIDDFNVMRNRWVLLFVRTIAGKVDRRSKPWLEEGGDFHLFKAIRYKGEDNARDVLLMPERSSPPPFDVTESRFVEAFRLAIADPRVASLLEDGEEETPWYKPRLDDTHIFWRILKQRYDEIQ